MGKGEETTHMGSVGALLELAAELERTPTRPSDTDIRQMGARLGLDHRTVRSAVRLRFGQERAGSPIALSRFIRPVAEYFAGVSVTHPYKTSFVLFVVFGAVLTWLGVSRMAGSGVAFGILLPLYILLCCGAQFARSSFRTATGVSAMLAALWMVVIQAVSLLHTAKIDVAGELLGSVMLFFALWIVGGMLLCFSAAAGGYVRSIACLRKERDADRQSLLRRVFEISAKLEDGEEPSAIPPRVSRLFSRDSALAKRLNPWLPASTFGFVAGLSLVVMGVQRAMIGDVSLRSKEHGALFMIVGIIGILHILVLYLGLFQLGVFAGSLRRTIWMVFALCAALFAAAWVQVLVWPESLAVGESATGWSLWQRVVVGQLINTAVTSLPIWAGAMAGYYWGYLDRERRLAHNDKQLLMEELTRLRSRLSQGVRHTCFLVVDVVGSTRMKEHADPLAIEYSFTEYQRYVASIVIACGGAVHSTAGDGAIASFPDPDSALEAGRQLQERLGDFNRSRNTLTDSFRLRVGIHAGEMTGSTYSHVIDVAAHVESACPPGSVAITHDALELLSGGPSFRNLEETVDERKVAVISPAAMELS